MISILQNVPDNVAAFEATGEVTKDNFENVVIPHVKKKVDQYDDLNYLLLLNTDVKNFTAGAWWEDAILGLKNLTKWNRAAIVTSSENIIGFTDFFSKIMPGEFKGFKKEEYDAAVQWVAGGGVGSPANSGL